VQCPRRASEVAAFPPSRMRIVAHAYKDLAQDKFIIGLKIKTKLPFKGLGINAPAREVLHADLKPGNVLTFQRRGEQDPSVVAKLADFGLATPFGSQVAGCNVYTPMYRPVECWCAGRQKLRLSWQSDVHALGCVFYDLMCHSGSRFLLPDIEDLSKVAAPSAAVKRAVCARLNARMSHCPGAAQLIRECTRDVSARPSLVQITRGCKHQIDNLI
jgi:serine/threonine protein kinase